MKILVVSSFLPYPLFSGGHIRLYYLIKELKNKHEVTLICEKRSNQTENDVSEVEKICKKVIVVNRKKQWSPQNIVKTGFSTDPFLLTGHKLSVMKKKIVVELTTVKYDVIHAETFYILQNIPKTYIPIVLVEHNIEYLVYKRFADTAPIPLRPFLLIDVLKLKRKEEAAWKRVKEVVAVSENERRIMNLANSSVVPNGVDTTKFKLKNLDQQTAKKQKRVLFIGDFKWIQNQDAVRFILTEIWPSVQQLIVSDQQSVKLWIVGRNIPSGIKNQTNTDSVIFDEDAPDTQKIFKQADVLLAPIRVGGGTQYKILEAMASGTPVVTTTLGLEGIDAQPDKDIMVADTAHDLADKTVSLLSNKRQFTSIAKNARVVIEKKYSWEIIARELDEVYKNAVKEDL